MQIFDISLPIHPQMLHWGRKPEVTTVESIAAGDASNVTRWLIGSHTGTHVDAPLHFKDGELPVDQIDMDVLVGPAVVLDLTGVTGQVGAAELEAAGLGDATRVILKTVNSSEDGALRADEKPSQWVGLAPDGAALLRERGVKIIAIDYLTLESPENTVEWETHHELLPNGVIILEGLDLAAVEAGPYEMVCLPLKLQGSEAAPARTILIRR
ncbi:cyclase family protein [Rhodococcus rhodochrous]|uniref:cyclase family protein n=1 Tax=Rhodococcus rhodochrous TaxID=1829 RepID=UPI001E3177E0|nr:cyclase family protein [Rhodococcus rhodochrous]MCD2097073.1 cyclase family protein [Rhodococcus rhodochrous]MCD2120495.1 cyclase family protein [Rhodococcus rhodochrous]MCQ4137112.1 cyclase family protein [Rhodococcus rhodochrous]MDJ0017360.1 cyclase family protein [Rhodococcus rhodochrous]